MATPDQTNDNWRGILWALVAVFGASALSICVRSASLSMDTRLIVGYRSFLTFAFLIIVILLIPRLRKQIRFSQPRAHIIRGFLMAASVQFGFYTLAVVPLAAAAILFALAPIFATLFSVMLGRETIGTRRIAAIVVGFIGAIIVIRPSGEGIDFNMIYGVASSICFGMSLVMSRNLARIDGVFSTVLSTSFFALLVAIPLAAPVFALPTDWSIMTWIIALILFGLLRQIADIRSYQFAQAAVLPPIAYLRLVIIGVAAYFLFSEIPTTNTYIGALIIISATLYITNRERIAKANGQANP